LPYIPSEKLSEIAARLVDVDKYVADESEAPGAETFRDELLEISEYFSSALDSK
jgi:hypothetical protein